MIQENPAKQTARHTSDSVVNHIVPLKQSAAEHQLTGLNPGRDCRTGEKSSMELSGSNVLRFELADGTTILVRPSGTEPKIKVYILTQGADADACAANVEKYSQWVKSLH